MRFIKQLMSTDVAGKIVASVVATAVAGAAGWLFWVEREISTILSHQDSTACSMNQMEGQILVIQQDIKSILGKHIQEQSLADERVGSKNVIKN